MNYSNFNFEVYFKRSILVSFLDTFEKYNINDINQQKSYIKHNRQ